MQTEQELLAQYRTNPLLWVKEVLNRPSLPIINEPLWAKQIEVLESVRDNRKTLVESGHGVGKTNVAATAALWFLFNFPDAIVLTTAPTARQVEAGLWKEIAIQNHPGLGGKLTHLKLTVAKDRWFALGFTARQSSDAEQAAASMQGFHAPHILVIFDEAAGVLPPFWTASNSLLTNEGARFLAIGNPTSAGTKFYEASLLPTYHHIRISCFDHPNVIHGKEIIPGAVTRQFIEDARVEWGEDSPMWASRVLGRPPDEGDDTLIRLSWAEASAAKEPTPAMTYPRVLAIDVARYGRDRTVMVETNGSDMQPDVESVQGKNTTQTTGRIIAKATEAMQNKRPYDYIVVDDGGVGGGVVDQLQEAEIDGKHLPVFPFNFAGASDVDQFANLRTQAYWKLREDIRTQDLKIQDELTLLAELTSIKYKYNGKGQLILESKEEIKRKGKRSPDVADALVMANWVRTRGAAEMEVAEADSRDEDSKETIFGDVFNEDF